MFPERTITGKYSLSQQRSHGPESPPNPEVLEVGGKKCLDVLWLSRDPDLPAHRNEGKGVAHVLKTSESIWKELLGFGHRDLMFEAIVADDALKLRLLRCLFAAMRSGKAMVLDKCEQKSEKEEGKGTQSHKYWHRHDERANNQKRSLRLGQWSACRTRSSGCNRGRRLQLIQTALYLWRKGVGCNSGMTSVSEMEGQLTSALTPQPESSCGRSCAVLVPTADTTGLPTGRYRTDGHPCARSLSGRLQPDQITWRLGKIDSTGLFVCGASYIIAGSFHVDWIANG
jgi:hypothetical protein